jgi:hypothetical protein
MDEESILHFWEVLEARLLGKNLAGGKKGQRRSEAVSTGCGQAHI